MSNRDYLQLEFAVSGFFDQVDVGYAKDGSLDAHQDGLAFKLFGYTDKRVLVECVLAPIDTSVSQRPSGTLFRDNIGTDELFGFSLPLPQKQFDWLWATVLGCGDRLSHMNVWVQYTPNKSADERKVDLAIRATGFVLQTGEYFADLDLASTPSSR